VSQVVAHAHIMSMELNKIFAFTLMGVLSLISGISRTARRPESSSVVRALTRRHPLIARLCNLGAY